MNRSKYAICSKFWLEWGTSLGPSQKYFVIWHGPCDGLFCWTDTGKHVRKISKLWRRNVTGSHDARTSWNSGVQMQEIAWWFCKKLIERTPMIHILQGTWVFWCKRFPDGAVRKLTVRFCVRGTECLYYFETFAQVGTGILFVYYWFRS